MSIQERIQMILKMHNLTPSAFADIIGIQRSSVSHVITGRNKPSLDFLEKIIRNFPRVNAHWLLTGQTSSEEVRIESKDEKSEPETKETIEEKPVLVKTVEFYSDNSLIEYFPKKK